MPHRNLPTRRAVLLAAGRTGLAVAIFGAAGCSADEQAGGASSDGSAPDGPAPADASTSPTAATPGGAGGTWKRVDLGFVSAYVLVRGSGAAIVDTGVAGSETAIGAVLDAAGPGWAGVRHVILTHRHADHAGSIAAVLQRATAAAGYIGEADLAQVSSPRPLTAVEDGAEVFGLQVVATPGHTAGHVSVFDPEAGVLVAGDALNNSDGLTGSNPRFTEDAAAAERSIGVLAKLPVRTVLFGHGAPLDSDAAAALRRLATG